MPLEKMENFFFPQELKEKYSCITAITKEIENPVETGQKKLIVRDNYYWSRKVKEVADTLRIREQ